MLENYILSGGVSLSVVSSQSKRHILIASSILFLLTLAVLSQHVTGYMLIASGSYFIMLLGILAIKMKDIVWHPRLMTLAMGLDLFLVLILELQRDAIKTAVSFELTPLQMGHIGASTIATALYFPTFYFGYKRWIQKDMSPANLKRHHKFAITAFLFRTLGFLLMFTLLSHVQKGA